MFKLFKHADKRHIAGEAHAERDFLDAVLRIYHHLLRLLHPQIIDILRDAKTVLLLKCRGQIGIADAKLLRDAV